MMATTGSLVPGIARSGNSAFWVLRAPRQRTADQMEFIRQDLAFVDRS